MSRSLCLAFLFLGGSTLLAAAADVTPAGAPSNAVEIAAPRANPYLSQAFAPDEVAVLPPPPSPGSGTQARDQNTFLGTRTLRGTARWLLAQKDANDAPAAVLADFSCAAGMPLDAARLPVLAMLLGGVNSDVYRAVEGPKNKYRRPRPLVGNDEPICVDRTERLTRSGSYPSGHATVGWVFALILAEAMPDRATAIIERGRVFGESRVVCGAHWLSDIEAGRLDGSALVAALHGSPAFRSDLDRARAEIEAFRQSSTAPPDAASCRAEAEVAATPIPQ